MEVKREHLAGLELALSIADTVCTDSIDVGQLEALIEQAKATPNCSVHAESGWQSFYAVGDQGQQYRCIRCGTGGASARGAEKPLTYNCHNPKCKSLATLWPTPQYAEYRKLEADRAACWAEFKIMTKACLAAESMVQTSLSLLLKWRRMFDGAVSSGDLQDLKMETDRVLPK